MKRFLTAEELVATYWQKLARSIERPNRNFGRAAGYATRSRKLSGVRAGRRRYQPRPQTASRSNS